jgi:hypothetical protein
LFAIEQLEKNNLQKLYPVKEKKIGIALSGGVDSTACALLLREQYEVKGFFGLQLPILFNASQPPFKSPCFWSASRVYCEQVGEYRQLAGSKGEISR